LLALLITPISNANDHAYTEYAFTAFTGYRVSDSLEDDDELTEDHIDIDETSTFGFILSKRRDRLSTYDLYFSRQDTELDFRTAGTPSDPLKLRFDYFHIGGTVDYEVDDMHPFATGGLGVTRITPANEVFGSETKFSFSLGGGIKVPIAENMGIRIEGRMLGTTTGGDGAILCVNGKCAARFEGSLFLQYEANIGFAIAF
jgi:opacity protein-like surface antigen